MIKKHVMEKSKDRIKLEDLHKLVDGLDIDKLSQVHRIAYHQYTHEEIKKFTVEDELLDLLHQYQLPKEKTLEQKLIDAGFVYISGCFSRYEINNIAIKLYDTYCEVSIIEDNEGLLEGSELFIDDINNHNKIFQAIEFLTKWSK